MAERWAEYMRVADLVPAPVNPKDHADGLIGGSLDRFGYVEPIALDERTGCIVSGHGRRDNLMAKEAAGEAVPEGVVARDDGWYALVVRGWASADDDEAVAAGVAINRIGEVGGWRHDALAEQLGRLVELPAGLDAVGFTLQHLDDLRGLVGAPPTLDQLADAHGAPDPTDFWPVMRLRCPPEVRQRFLALVGDLPDDEQLGRLVEMAEAPAAVQEAS